MKELLLPFGALKAFNLVMDKNTGNSKVTQALSSFSHTSVHVYRTLNRIA